MAKVVRVKRKPEKKDSGKQVQKTFEFKHGFMVGLNDDYREVTWEEAQERIRRALEKEFPGGRFTPVGGLILIDGKACYPHDFDYEAMDRKPGTHPPLYTLTKEEQELVKVEERIARESKNPNTLARNPTNLLTSREIDKLNSFRRNKFGEVMPNMPVDSSPVEWNESDINDEDVVAQETKKVLRKITVKKTDPAPVRKKVVVKRARG